MAESILEKPVKMKHIEPAVETNFEEFRKVVQSRRSVRIYEPLEIPDPVVHQALDMALLAPNSSNLQTWEFYWVKNPEKKQALAEACFGQQTAKTAPVLIVCVARPSHWKKHSQQMLDFFKTQAEVPSIARTYYSKVAPLAYYLGPLNIFGFLKWIAFSVIGIFRPVPRGPVLYSQLREWAVKSTALACENLMLAFRALGYDSCPMEGFDEVRVRRILNLPRNAHIVMIVSAGKRAAHGVYGPQVRFPRDQFIKVIQ